MLHGNGKLCKTLYLSDAEVWPSAAKPLTDISNQLEPSQSTGIGTSLLYKHYGRVLFNTINYEIVVDQKKQIADHKRNIYPDDNCIIQISTNSS